MILANFVLTGNDNNSSLDNDNLCLLRLIGKESCLSKCPGGLDLSWGASLAQQNVFVQLDLHNLMGRARSILLLLVLFILHLRCEGVCSEGEALNKYANLQSKYARNLAKIKNLKRHVDDGKCLIPLSSQSSSILMPCQ
jgi:hypothetical protein